MGNGANPSVEANSVGPASDWVSFPDPLPDTPVAKFLTFPMNRTPGVDNVYVSLDVGDASPFVQRDVRDLAGTSSHEMFHGSKLVNTGVQVGLAIERVLDPNLDISGENERILRGILEHVVITKELARIALEADGMVLSRDTASLSVYQNAYDLALDELRRTGGIINPDVLKYAGTSEGGLELFAPEQKGIQNSLLGVSDHAGIRGTGLHIVDVGNDGDRTNDYFVDAQNNVYYRTPDILNRDPEEEERAADNLAYWQGVLGSGSNSSSGNSAAAGNGAGGAGGGSPNLPNDDDDDNDGPKPPPIPYVNPNPKPLPSGNPIDPDAPKPTKDLNPILLDLDGNGIQISGLNRSTVFMEGEEGLEHRTAWAGAGDGVLFYDTDGDNAISDIREYVFTEWDPTAKDDLAALRSQFDTNGDGKLTLTELTGFKVMKTNPDGALTAVTLASLGITQINLTEDTTHIEMPDGSVITGQGTFVMGGVTRTLANTTLATEADGSRVETTDTGPGATRTVVQTGFDAAGAVEFRITSVTNTAGTSITNSFDDNGDGVVLYETDIDSPSMYVGECVQMDCGARQLGFSHEELLISAYLGIAKSSRSRIVKLSQ